MAVLPARTGALIVGREKEVAREGLDPWFPPLLGIGVMLNPLNCPSRPDWIPSRGRRLAREWSTASGPEISTPPFPRQPPSPCFFSWLMVGLCFFATIGFLFT